MNRFKILEKIDLVHYGLNSVSGVYFAIICTDGNDIYYIFDEDLVKEPYSIRVLMEVYDVSTVGSVAYDVYNRMIFYKRELNFNNLLNRQV